MPVIALILPAVLFEKMQSETRTVGEKALVSAPLVVSKEILMSEAVGKSELLSNKQLKTEIFGVCTADIKFESDPDIPEKAHRWSKTPEAEVTEMRGADWIWSVL